MDYRIEFAVPPSPQLWRLFLTTGWNDEYAISSEAYEKACRDSWFAVSAYDGEWLVGFGRVLSDGLLHAMIYDLITDPRYQGRGIGTKVLDALVSRCRAEGIRDVQLFCAEGKRRFYEQRGFHSRPDQAPGMELGVTSSGRDAARSPVQS